MGEVIRCWLRQRLGAIIDLSPRVFGHYTRDGTLLAKLLYNYGIINETQLKTIIPTQDPALARVNLKNLRAWIKFIGIDLNDDCIDDISQGKGITSLQVFYKIFLCLETKDRLHFITQQKERKKYIPTSRKFDVKALSEEVLVPSINYSLTTSLNTTATVIDWYRKKFLKLIDDYKQQKEELNIDRDNEKTHEKCKDKKNFTTNEDIINATIPDDIIINDNTEIMSLDYLKNTKATSLTAETLKIRSQGDYLNSLVENGNSTENKLIDVIIAKKILRESSYERQMIEKLEKIRKAEDWIAENRRLVESLMQEAKESNQRQISLEYDEILRNKKRIQDENRRFTELNKKLASTSLDKSQEYLNKLGRLITRDLAEMAISKSDYKNLYGNDVPNEIFNEWKSLFIKGLALMDIQNIYEFNDNKLEFYEEEEEEENYEFNNSNEMSMEKIKYFDKRDLEDYLNFHEPWINFIPELNEESRDYLNSGSQVLGHIIYKLLTNFHRPSTSAPLSNFSIRTALLGVPHDFPINILRDTLAQHKIQVIAIPDAVNYCLDSHKVEISGKSKSTSEEDVVDNNLITTAGFVGASINESLMRGEGISDELIIKALLECIKGMENIRGWVIINYPLTYCQMINLEASMAGQPLPSHKDQLSKYSRLFPNPSYSMEMYEIKKTHLTSLIRFKTTEELVHVEIPLIDNENEVIKFYTNQGILLEFNYTMLDEETMHKLCDLIIPPDNGFTVLAKDASLQRESKAVINDKGLMSIDGIFTKFPKEFPEDFVRKLAETWKAQEEVYVESLIESLSLRKLTFLTIIPYTSFITKYMYEYMNRTDKKRNDILEKFRKAFNELPQELRNDCNVKCELYCRVRDFQLELWEISRIRRDESRTRVKSIIQYHWTSTQIIIITNIYLSVVERELERFVNTLYTIESYYLLILQRALRSEPFTKPILTKICLSSDINKTDMDNEIECILLDKNETFNLSETICFKLMKTNIDNCQAIVNNYSQLSQKFFDENTKKIKKAEEKNKRVSKNTNNKMKKNESKNSENTPDDDLQNIGKEWNCALRYEITRINTILKILKSSWQSDVNFLLTIMKQAFNVIMENINVLYKEELENTNDIAKLFCMAIEYERELKEIDEEMENVFQLPTEITDYYGFKISQIGRLKDIFQRIAPTGFLCQRAFKYILEDIIYCLHGEFEGEALLPDSWRQLQPGEIGQVINKLFGNNSHVNWRDFLIYAMDIEMPSQEQLLDTLEIFRKKDRDGLGIVSKATYYNLPLWFDDPILTPSINSWLHEDYERDENYLSDLENNYDEQAHNIRMSSGKKSISFRSDSIRRKNLLIDDVTPEEIKYNLIKELLGEMFIEDKNYVNYLKLLLYFCKDEDPRRGLANALSIILNCRVSSDFHEGEEYVRKSIEEQGDMIKINQENIKMISEMLNKILDDIIDFPKSIININDDDMSITKDRIVNRKSFPIFIETLDKSRENIIQPSMIELNDINSSISIISESSSAVSEQLSQCQSIVSHEQCYWISITRFEKLLQELTPHLMEQIHNTGKNLIENFKLVYDEITCLNNQPDVVLIHKLISSEFVLVYLSNTSQFTWKSVNAIIKDIINSRTK